MVLYCTQHPSSIIRAIVHKMKYHENEDAIIIGEPALHTPYYPQIPGISYLQTPDIWKMVSFSNEREKLIQNTLTTIDNFAESSHLNFKEFTHRYALYDQYNPFTVYFERNYIDYECIEMSANEFYRYYAYGHQRMAEVPDQAKCYTSLILELHSQDGTGKYCLKGYLYSGESRIPEVADAQYEVFDYLNSIPNLKPEQKEMLLSAYQIKEYPCESIFLLNSQGLVTYNLQHYQALPSDKSDDGQIIASQFYMEIIDYYLSDRTIALKLHPAAGQKMISLFSSFEQISNYIPFELFVLLDKKYKLFSVCSTADEIFKERGWDVVTFGGGMFSFFKFIHFVSLAFRFIERLSIPDQIYVYGLDIQQLNYFRDYAHLSFAAVQFVQLTAQNASEAEFIVAVPDPAFYTVTKSASKNAVIVTNRAVNIEGYRQILMKCSVVDISESKNNAIQEFDWSVYASAENICQIALCFCVAYILKNSKLIIQSEPHIHVLVNTDSSHKISSADPSESLRLREQRFLRMFQYLQMYYETERTGYTFRDYLEEIGLLADNIKLAFFAVDELGVYVYNICQRLGIHFTVLVSDKDREIRCATHQNMTESVKCTALEKVEKSLYTHVFMAIVWNGEQINYVKKYTNELLLFDAVACFMYTRAFFIDRITDIRKKNPGVKTGIFFTPYVSQIPGQHSEIEEYFCKQGSHMPNITRITDDKMKAKAKEECYGKYGYDDEYINGVCNVPYPIHEINGVYLMEDHNSKYSNVVSHHRVVTDLPAHSSNMVYFFGDSVVTGLHVDDAGTIESSFQRILNNENLPYTVQNCANSWGLHYDWIFTLTDTMRFKPGDILLFCTRVDFLTEGYIRLNRSKMLNGSLGIYTTPVFQRPHDHGEVFTDDHHFNAKGYGLIAQKIFDDIKAAGFFNPHDIAEDAGTGTER